MSKELTVEVEGKKTTIKAKSNDEMLVKLKAFADENKLGRYIVKDESGKKLTPNELGEVKSVKLLRTEVAGDFCNANQVRYK